jgi:hypothetical protein
MVTAHPARRISGCDPRKLRHSGSICRPLDLLAVYTWVYEAVMPNMRRLTNRYPRW